jgi:hypothetical protein
MASPLSREEMHSEEENQTIFVFVLVHLNFLEIRSK